MSKPPRVSVVLPVRDGESSIEAALKSVLQQDEPDWELIVVDDGSRDSSADRVQAVADDDPRIRLLRRPAKGIVAALNEGLSHATAPLIARMDADDVMYPSRLRRQCDWLDSDPGTGLVACRVEFGGDTQRGYARYVDWINGLRDADTVARRRFIESPVAHPAVCFRRVLVDAYGTYRDGDFPEDYELWLRWLRAGVRFHTLDEVLLRWNDSPRRLSRTHARYRTDAFYRTKCEYLRHYLADSGLMERSLWLWGSGRTTRRRFQHLEVSGSSFAGFIDIDPAKCGQRIDGRPVVFPEQLLPNASHFILAGVGSWDARERIHAWLQKNGWVEGRDYLLAA